MALRNQDARRTHHCRGNVGGAGDAGGIEVELEIGGSYGVTGARLNGTGIAASVMMTSFLPGESVVDPISAPRLSVTVAVPS